MYAMQLGNNVFGSYSRVTVKDVAGPFLHAPPSAFRNVVWLEEDNACELAQAIRAASRYLSNDEGSNSTLTEVPVSATLTELKIGRGCYNKVTALDLSGCARLESVEIGDFSLINCVLFKCCGLKALRRIVVGEKCFCNPGDKEVPQGSFQLKECKQLKELRIGCLSFADYSECDMQDLDALETVVIGNAKTSSCCFYWSDLELRGGNPLLQ